MEFLRAKYRFLAANRKLATLVLTPLTASLLPIFIKTDVIFFKINYCREISLIK